MALQAKKLVVQANIDVIGSGFKGTTMLIKGTPDNCSVDPTTAYTLNSTATQSYTKGEGIVPDNTAFNRGRAPRANGGGSGISGDSGGGGGSSYGSGGMGGYRWCDELGPQDGGPDIPAGGLGGVALSPYFPEDRLFLGGAGGSGFVTTNNLSDATDGGGIVILFVDTLVGNGFSILADGTSPVSVNPVGAPDGGGGGSVLLNVNSIVGNLTVSADGGDGQDLNTNNYHGPGGGGGGGVLLYSLPALPAYVTFSAVGGSSGVHSDGYDNGAEDGQDGGTFGLYVPIENVNYRANVDNDDVTPTCDIDDDNDGIPDIQEIYTNDHDNDGILDWQDPDFCLSTFEGVNGWSCAVDGLPNPTADLDEDGYANFIDADFPYCGTFVLGIDQICSNFDPDGDGIPSHLDLDSDNDGIADVIEAGGVDTDADGIVDVFDPSNGGTYIDPVDTDGDGTPDFLDLDSDDDTYPDVIEGHDVNGDGIPDGTSPANTGVGGVVDVDGDGLLDGFDNNVGSFDFSNGTLTPSSYPDAHNPGADRDWRDNKDTDDDGIPDFLDIDDDNDGIPDIAESGGFDPDGNEDGDEFPNWLDTNDDGNGGDGSLTSYADANGDGIPDVYDFDGDGIPNHLDKDTDNDGIVDIIEAGGTDLNQDGEVDYVVPGVATTMIDLDNDGLFDLLDNVDNGGGISEVTSGTPLPAPDTDGDGLANYLDIDSDDDVIVDNIEA